MATLLTGALVGALAIVGVAAPAQAAGPGVTVPVVPRTGATVAVSGTGFDSSSFGIYLGVRAAGSATDTYTVWIDDTNTVGTLPGLGATAPMTVDGSFTVEVPIPAADGTAYSIVTRGAHGQPMPQNETTTPVVYEAEAVATSTTLTASPDGGAVAGSTVTLRATVSPTASGTVTFSDGATVLGTGAVNGSGIAELSTTTLAVGGHTLTAVFAPTDPVAFTASSSSGLAYAVTARPAIATTTTLAAPTPATRALLGADVTLTATVAAASGADAPTGTVEFFQTPAGSTTPASVGTASVTAGSATLVTAALTAGGHAFTAVYSPADGTFSGSSSAASVNYGIVDTRTPAAYVPAADALETVGASASWAFSAYSNATSGAGAWAKAADGENVTATTGGTFEFSNGVVTADAGGARISFDGWFRITPNAGYGATFTDPVLSLRADGSGVWTADVTTFGDAGSVTHDDMVFAVFSGATVGGPGSAVDTTIALQYANAVAQGSFNVAYANSWPAGFVLALDPRIQSYFYQTSTSAANLTKPASAVKLTFDWPEVEATATSLTVAPATRALVGEDVTLTATVTNTDDADDTPSGAVDFFSVAAGTATRVSLGSSDLEGGVATLTTDALTAGGHTFVAVYTPDSAAFAGSEKATTANVGIVDAAQPVAYVPGADAVVSETAATASWAWSAYAAGWTKVATGDITVADGVFQFANGVVTGDAGGAVVQFDGTVRVEAYAGFFPPNGQWVELVDPALHLKADGSGVWVADVRSGAGAYSASATTRLVVGTFSGVQNVGMATDGARTVAFDYSGATARGTWHADYANSWPNAFVLAVPSAIQSFYYQSGTSAAQATKPAAPLTVDFDWPVVAEDTTTTLAVAPATRAVRGSDVTLTSTVSPSTATGTVEFFDAGIGGAPVSLGTGVVTAGVATLTTGALAAGGHAFSAVYTPDSVFFTGSSSSTTANYGIVDTAIDVPVAPTSGTAVSGVTARWNWSAYASGWTKVASGDVSVADGTFVLSGGTGIVGDDGSISLAFTGTLRVEAYGGFFPPNGQWVELVDPTLVIDARGAGTWSAGVRSGSGAYAASATQRLVVATLTDAPLPDFSKASVDTSFAFDYAGTVAAGTWSVKNGTAFTDAWTNEFILAVPSAIQAFYYASGAQADATKAPASLSLAWSTTPVITVEGTPRAGGQLTVTGTGFTSGQNVLVEVHSTPYALGSATVGAGRGFSVTGTLPADFPTGAHTVVAIVDGTELASAPVTVAAAVPAPAVETAPVATCTAQAVSGASFSWGVKESFVSYVNGPIAKGSASISWGSGSGAYNTSENLGRVNYGGSAVFTGHGGILDLTLSNPTVQVNGTGSATLSVVANGSRVTIATLSLPAASVSGSAISWRNASATLTSAGAALFSYNGNAFYPAGTALDPVSFTFPLGADVPCDTSTSGELAATGGQPQDGTVWFGLGLLVLGAALVVARRRRTLIG
ncbi:MAG: Ig-like domain repeat protein [Microbacterium sp.]|uniref:Ig-like domain repeat protein n=1 Tax=Microbacterium sp. TaxID=51671 RepID=UPI001AC625BE|nr:Ig-like domain repeat protein [Microbacterium sp.]MBN9176736.1 Ig-like domain repeat protein [Microbacterium sp.]